VLLWTNESWAATAFASVLNEPLKKDSRGWLSKPWKRYINAHEMSDTEFVKSSQIVADMVLLALRDSCDTVCGETAVRTANVLRAKRIIRQRMTNPDLTATDIANATGISLSYLYELFHDCAGCTAEVSIMSKKSVDKELSHWSQ
jgi:hypothetical protein